MQQEQQVSHRFGGIVRLVVSGSIVEELQRERGAEKTRDANKGGQLNGCTSSRSLKQAENHLSESFF